MQPTLLDPAPNAALGSVEELDAYGIADFPPTAAVLCRTTAPLVSFALDCLTRGLGCTIAGRDLAAGLVALLEKRNATSVPDLKEKLLDYRHEQCKKLCRKGKQSEAAALADKVSALLVLARNATSVAAVKAKLEDLFKPGKDLLLLSTVHRAKGLEWDTVFILDFNELMPSPWAKEEELEQEHNLIYVAQTRARLHLRYINSNCWKI